MNSFEKPYWDKKQLVLGVDEVGRGPLAGPLVVCGVILPMGFNHPMIADSKTLSEKKRQILYPIIINEAVEIIIIRVNEPSIDFLNIYQATKLAMMEIIRCSQANFALTDAMPGWVEGKEITSIVKGDSLSISIAAASIVAKVIRDYHMKTLHKQYPQYEFNKNKGYGTKAHFRALKEFGPTPVHRYSYAPVALLSQMKLKI